LLVEAHVAVAASWWGWVGREREKEDRYPDYSEAVPGETGSTCEGGETEASMGGKCTEDSLYLYGAKIYKINDDN
jgi:hypothetical protein